ncbi:MAG: Hsp70 family protein [Pseudonocardia sp.]
MSYGLGIDVGTSYTAASVCRGAREPEVVPLGSRSTAVASVVFLGSDGQVVVGDGAERRALTDPDHVVREFKRRIGDDVPFMVGGEPRTAHEIAATVVSWVVSRVAEREGGPADRVVLTHPAGWGPYKKALLADALAETGLPDVTFLTEPEAAAVSYAAQARIAPGATVAVYDLGGGTFDAAIVRKTGTDAFEVLGTPEGIDSLGGVDFDQAVFDHVRTAAGPSMAELDPADPDVLAAMARVRRECTEAKEALSCDTDATIPVLLPGSHTQVRLVRSEFEDMVRGPLGETVDALRRAMDSAGVTVEDLDAVLLVGGSSRVPLVAQLVSAELGRPIAIDADPKTTIAAGAALTAAPASVQNEIATATRFLGGDAETPQDGGAPWPDSAPVRPAATTSAPALATDERDEPDRSPVQRLRFAAAAGVLAIALIGAAALVPMTSTGASESATGEAGASESAVNPAAPIDDKASLAGTSNTAGRGPQVDTVAATSTGNAAPPSTAAAGPGTAGGRTGGPAATTPGTTQPGTPDPGTPIPGTPDPGTPDPGTPDPGTPDPGTPDPGTPDPGTPDPGTPDPGTPVPGTPEPDTPAPSDPPAEPTEEPISG